MLDSHPQRIGLFGGSFDPIHNGHLIMAQDACEQLGLDYVYFIPAGEAPLRTNTPQATAADRQKMVELAIHDDPRFKLSTVDLEREGVSYSIQTVETLKSEHPNDRLYWIAGADQAAQLREWRQIDDIAQMADFIFLERDGFHFDTIDLPPQIRSHRAPTHTFDISSSEIRQRLKEGKAVNYFLPATVLDYIKTQNLYS